MRACVPVGGHHQRDEKPGVANTDGEVLVLLKFGVLTYVGQIIACSLLGTCK
jgi:hypothetical protein